MHPRGLCPVVQGGECRHKGVSNLKQSPWFVEMMSKRKVRFERDEIQCLILDVLKDRECHGYDIMQSISEWTDGMYRPSPGALYPALRTLEDSGMISSRIDGRRKMYSLTDNGKAELSAKHSLLQDIYEDIQHNKNPQWEEFFVKAHEDISEIFRSVSRAFRRGDVEPEKVNKIHEIIRNASASVLDILNK